MEQLCRDLLQDWCQALLQMQIRGTGNSRLDGAILCPACGRIHGRCFEAMYPFLHMAKVSKDDKWIRAAEQLFDWAERVVSQPDGSYVNDIDSDWKGTTVFNTIQLADCLLIHADVIPESAKNGWRKRLKKAAEFLYTFDEINDNNINYPISNALALYECGMVLEEERFQEKARSLASMAEAVLTKRHLIFGEGVPRFQKSRRGCVPVDIGYNVEETLPSLALYGILSGDVTALRTAEKGLLAQLDFMAENGAWDNSFGTRNFKWTYWGSRTSDGCALGYLLLADRHPEFALAAKKNIELLRQCTSDGLLAGGPHYDAAGQPACVHHTFAHAKVLAGIMDRNLCAKTEPQGKLPRQQAVGIRHYREIDSWLMTCNSMTATVTAYDWEYLRGGHVSGGTISFCHHSKAETLLCAGVGAYMLKEPNNMQIPIGVRHECLALRIEKQIGDTLYSSIYEDCAEVSVKENVITVHGCLKDMEHQASAEKELAYGFRYEWSEDTLLIKAELEDGILVCPLISRSDEYVDVGKDGKEVTIRKRQAEIRLKTSSNFKMPYGTERIFNLVPGLQALRVDLPLVETSYILLTIITK